MKKIGENDGRIKKPLELKVGEGGKKLDEGSRPRLVVVVGLSG